MIGDASLTISGVLKLMDRNCLCKWPQPKFNTVDATRTQLNTTMKFDGNLDKFKKFDPEKTRILEFSQRDLQTDIFFARHLTSTSVPSLSKALKENSISAALEYLSLAGDHSQFALRLGNP